MKCARNIMLATQNLPWVNACVNTLDTSPNTTDHIMGADS